MDALFSSKEVELRKGHEKNAAHYRMMIERSKEQYRREVYR